MLTTPMSFVASANCALFVGARPVFSDIDPVTANLDLSGAARRGLTAGAKACVAVSMAGLPIDLDPIQEARVAGMTVIEERVPRARRPARRLSDRRRRAGRHVRVELPPGEGADYRRGRDGGNRQRGGSRTRC